MKNDEEPRRKPLPPKLEDVPPEDLVSVGGPIQNSTVSLRLFGDDLEPAEVSSLLGSQPTEARKKGELIAHSRYHRQARTGSWLLKSRLDRNTDLAKQIEALLNLVTSDVAVWRKLTERYSVDLFCGVFLDADNRGFDLSPHLVLRLAERGLSIGFDIYGPASE
jgi:hypothetical protein